MYKNDPLDTSNHMVDALRYAFISMQKPKRNFWKKVKEFIKIVFYAILGYSRYYTWDYPKSDLFMVKGNKKVFIKHL